MTDIQAAPCQFFPFASGTADFVYSSVPTGGAHPGQLGAINGKTYLYFATDPATGLQTEGGYGTWVSATNTLQRTTILFSSDFPITLSPGKTNFGTIPLVTVNGPFVLNLTQEEQNLPSSTANADGPIPTGTVMLFRQATTPVGWTRVTGFNDYALRISDGTPSFGGSSGFSSVFSQSVTGSHTPGLADMVDHTHAYQEPQAGVLNIPGGCPVALAVPGSTGTSTGGMGGGSAAHNHTVNLLLAYVDVLLASKN